MISGNQWGIWACVMTVLTRKASAGGLRHDLVADRQAADTEQLSDLALPHHVPFLKKCYAIIRALSGTDDKALGGSVGVGFRGRKRSISNWI